MKKKFLLTLIITAIALYLVLVIVSYSVSRRLNDSIDLMEYYIEGTQEMRNASILVRKIDSDVHSYLLSGDEKNIASLESDSKQLDAAIAYIEKHTNEQPLQQQRLDEIKRLRKRRRGLIHRSIEAYRKGQLSATDILAQRQLQTQLSEDILAIFREIDRMELDMLNSEKAQQHKLQVQNYVLDFAAGLGPLIIALITVYALVKIIKAGKAIELQLTELNRNKDKFISIIGHDLKGPAGAIKLIADLLVQNGSTMPTEKLLKMHERLQHATENHVKLLQDILTWARTQTTEVKVNLTAIDVSGLVEEVLLYLSEIAKSKGILLENKVSEDITVLCDENMLRTVLRNLVQNALKFTGKNGKVWIDAAKVGNFTEIRICDTGVGMKKNQLDRLFKIGMETSTRGTEGESGSGLGLLISKEFIEKNNGTIRVESEPGKGSIFTIQLPSD